MKRFEGSPAPWRINGVDYHDYGLVDAEGGEIMLLKAECEQDDHNATLIAAAPDLLEALQAMLNKAYKQNWNDQYPDEVSKAQAAISKALGEE
ncbi:hypothetical protein EKS35_13970 [Enterobacter hormaechei subsp. steigerwaltii]|uniref:hypothetical protein n=1 Tax=Enterobacter hormaechei TaxID=158836 RepID=UPI000F84BCD0|nr:hypothetical protein [Enterobacter hormaechei]RTY44040.1 hypothetical protein EKS35_13970 [Enterobacter hormaechei subsp. steigerwaltii]